MPGHDGQGAYRDAVDRKLMHDDFVAQRMLNGGSPGGSGWSCAGAFITLTVVLFVIGLIFHGALYVAHLAEHLWHLL